MLKAFLIKNSYGNAFWTTVFACLVYPFAMVALDRVTGAGAFSIAALMQVVKVDLPFFALFLAGFNFFGAWLGARMKKKESAG